MGEKKVKEFLTYEELKAEFVSWSMDTVRRRIKNDGFPAIRDGSRYLFPTEKVLLWFKQREVRS